MKHHGSPWQCHERPWGRARKRKILCMPRTSSLLLGHRAISPAGPGHRCASTKRTSMDPRLRRLDCLGRPPSTEKSLERGDAFEHLSRSHGATGGGSFEASVGQGEGKPDAASHLHPSYIYSNRYYCCDYRSYFAFYVYM